MLGSKRSRQYEEEEIQTKKFKTSTTLAKEKPALPRAQIPNSLFVLAQITPAIIQRLCSRDVFDQACQLQSENQVDHLIMDENEDGYHKFIHIKGTVLTYRISLQLSYALGCSALSPDIQISKASQCSCGTISQNSSEFAMCPHLTAVLVTIYRTGTSRIEKFQTLSEILNTSTRDVSCF